VPPARFAAIRSRLGVRAPRIDSTRPETGREKIQDSSGTFRAPMYALSCRSVPFSPKSDTIGNNDFGLSQPGRNEAAELPLNQPRKGNCCAVFKTGAQ